MMRDQITPAASVELVKFFNRLRQTKYAVPRRLDKSVNTDCVDLLVVNKDRARDDPGARLVLGGY